MPSQGKVNFARRFEARLRDFARDTRGATALEFSIVSIPFLGILFAIFQTSFLFLVQQGLDSATERGARNIKTGQTMTSNITDGATFCTSVLATSLPSYLSCSNLIIDVRSVAAGGSWSGFNTSTDILTTTPKFCIGAPGSIVVVRVMYPVPPMLSIMTVNDALSKFGSSSAGQSLNSSGKLVYPIMGVFAFQAEPYSASTYTPPASCDAFDHDG